MSSAVARSCDNVASSHASAGTASMASAIAAGFGAECINPAAIRMCSSNSLVTAAVAPVGASPIASLRRRGTDRRVTARSRGEELLIGTSWHPLDGRVDAHRSGVAGQVD